MSKVVGMEGFQYVINLVGLASRFSTLYMIQSSNNGELSPFSFPDPSSPIFLTSVP